MRARFDAPLHPADMVRISIESAQDGYLYIVDQELSPAPGRPCVIFPSPLIRGSENHVRAGDVVDLPPLDRSVPPYWLLLSKDPRYAGELLSLIMSPQRLNGLPQGGPCPEVPPEEFRRWTSQWTASYEVRGRAELVGRPASQAEVDAGRGAKILTLDDPPPQTVLWLSGSNRTRPVLVSLPLRVVH